MCKAYLHGSGKKKKGKKSSFVVAELAQDEYLDPEMILLMDLGLIPQQL